MFQHLQSCNHKLQELITELGNIDAVVTKTMVESMIHQAVKVKENLKSSSAAQINSQIIDNLKTEFKQKEEYVFLLAQQKWLCSKIYGPGMLIRIHHRDA